MREKETKKSSCLDNNLQVDGKYKVDLLVIGAGGAGLMAAIEAWDKSLDVLIVEMQESPFFSESALCGGGAAIPGNIFQLREGILDDSSELLYEDIMRVGRYTNIEYMVHLFTDNLMEAYNRWTKFGIEPINHKFIGGHSRKRVLCYINRDVIKKLYTQIKNRKIIILFNTRVKKLLFDYNERRVYGAIAVKGVEAPFFNSNSGKKIFIQSKATVICTGGMCGNPELIKQYVPKLGKFSLACWGVSGEPGLMRFPEGVERPIGLGDGYLLGMDIGAATTHMCSITTYTGIPYYKEQSYSNWFDYSFFPGYTHGAIAVNIEGNRFIEETTSAPCEIGEVMLLQKEKTLFQIWDTKIYNTLLKHMIQKNKKNQIEELNIQKEKNNYLFQGNSIEECANKAKINVEGLKKTIEN